MNAKKHLGESIRFGIVGAGRIAEAYAAAFQTAGNAALTCVADVLPAPLAAMSAKWGCHSFDSHIAMAESGLVDAVIVSTPPATHDPICLYFLERRIPVLCEKPVSLSPESARLIRRRALEKKTLFAMASKFRYAEDVTRARSIVTSGILGQLVLFENTFMSFVDMSRRWNADPAVSGGGVLIDNGTHSVDIMRYFLGTLASIHVVGGTSIQELPVEDTVHVTVRTEAGAVGKVDLSWSINKQCDDYIAIYGTKGTLRVGWKGSFYRQEGNQNWVQFGEGYNKVQAFKDQIENFAASVQGLETLRIDATDAVASVDVIRAGYQALENETWEAIPSSEMTSAAVASGVMNGYYEVSLTQ